MDKIPVILSFDIDKTQIPSHNLVTNQADPFFPDSRRLQKIIEELRRSGHALMVHNSGRALTHILQEIPAGRDTNKVLARPDAIIANVGTEIHVMYNDQPVLLRSWEHYLEKQFPNALRVELETKFRGFSAKNPGVQLQDAAQQGRFKLSFKLTGDRTLATAAALNDLFKPYRGVRTTFSHGWAYDVTPERATKGTALEHLAASWKIPFDRCIVAGDSGNDLPMFRPAFRGIVPANGDDELRAGLKGRENIVYASAPIAAGVIEGLHTLGILPPQPAPPTAPRRGLQLATHAPAQ